MVSLRSQAALCNPFFERVWRLQNLVVRVNNYFREGTIISSSRRSRRDKVAIRLAFLAQPPAHPRYGAGPP